MSVTTMFGAVTTGSQVRSILTNAKAAGIQFPTEFIDTFTAQDTRRQAHRTAVTVTPEKVREAINAALTEGRDMPDETLMKLAASSVFGNQMSTAIDTHHRQLTLELLNEYGTELFEAIVARADQLEQAIAPARGMGLKLHTPTVADALANTGQSAAAWAAAVSALESLKQVLNVWRSLADVAGEPTFEDTMKPLLIADVDHEELQEINAARWDLGRIAAEYPVQLTTLDGYRARVAKVKPALEQATARRNFDHHNALAAAMQHGISTWS